jgi:hypothetical protein
VGVEFFPCAACGESICDCGRYEQCGCGRRWCDLKCAAEDGYAEGEGVDPECWDGFRETWTCAYCRLENFEDGELLNHLLRRYNLTREQVVEDRRRERRNQDPPDAD